MKTIKQKAEEFINDNVIINEHWAASWVKKFAQHLSELQDKEGGCTKCNTPFEPHHHKHITEKGIYHTSCYKKLQDKGEVKEEGDHFKKVLEGYDSKDPNAVLDLLITEWQLYFGKPPGDTLEDLKVIIGNLKDEMDSPQENAKCNPCKEDLDGKCYYCKRNMLEEKVECCYKCRLLKWDEFQECFIGCCIDKNCPNCHQTKTQEIELMELFDEYGGHKRYPFNLIEDKINEMCTVLNKLLKEKGL